METSPTSATVPPPRLVQSLRAGFDTVATHIGLILFPIVLDCILWFGPHLNLNTLFQSRIAELFSLPGFDSPDAAALIKTSQDIWQTIIPNFNLVSALRTFPVGVPSLMSGQAPMETPLGGAPIRQVTSLSGAFAWWLLFILVGMVAGSLYFKMVARAVNRDKSPLTVQLSVWTATQVILLALTWVVLLIALMIPGTFFLTVLALINPVIAQFAVFVFGILLIWILVPLLFSPHGIFVYHQNALISMLTSARLVRFILPGTALFFVSGLVLSQGLDLLWVAPPPTSWMASIGVVGHAFITTSLLAASFVYYRDAMRFVQEFLQRTVLTRSKTTEA